MDLTKYKFNSKEEKVKVWEDTWNTIIKEGWNERAYSNLIEGEVKSPFPSLEIEVINQDCLEVLEDLYNEDFGVCLLNFASAKQPGGGVLTGATAQEEEICRRSNLMAHLLPYSSKAKQFNLKPKKQIYGTSGEWLIYSESVIFFKDKDYKSFIESRSPFDADVISCSAPNRNNPEPKEGWEIFTKRKMRNILRTAINRGNDALVLGAWGCGVFKNPPEEMAKWWHEVICEQEFYNRFRKIVFAILNDNNSVSNNYKIFKKEFR